ncbi:MAG: hypothetical protein K8T89_18865 [Planctomycetes bacterium]|nr:hypothetical protein [Planctomycetota bacterium]
MTFEGIVTNGIIVLDDDARLPEGTRVEVEVKESPVEEKPSSSLNTLLKFAGLVKDLQPGMALNHDHYLHGAPKR